jgi:hypothetical protein
MCRQIHTGDACVGTGPFFRTVGCAGLLSTLAQRQDTEALRQSPDPITDLKATP